MNGKIAIVTGTAGGIGRGIAEVLLREGCRVVAADRDETEGLRTARELSADPDRIRFVEADVSREADIQRIVDSALEHWGTVDILVNNVGTHFYRPVESIRTEDWDRVVATDLRAHFLAAKLVLPVMRERGGGAIVNIASVHALQTSPHFSVYAAAKGGVVSMSRSLALENAPYGIRVNAVLPGLTRNRNVDRRLADMLPDERDKWRKEAARNVPLGRMAEPAEIGEAVAFLASDRASFITGASLVVDGGESAHL